MEIKTAVSASDKRRSIFTRCCSISRIFAVAAIAMFVVMGCSGTMNGVIRRDAKRIEFTYTDSRVSAAEIIVVMPDGERFRGKTERFSSAKEIMENNADDIGVHFEELQTFNGNAKATLTGNRGNKMKCRFHLADYIIGFNAGGFGVCQLADGRVVDVFF